MQALWCLEQCSAHMVVHANNRAQSSFPVPDARHQLFALWCNSEVRKMGVCRANRPVLPQSKRPESRLSTGAGFEPTQLPAPLTPSASSE